MTTKWINTKPALALLNKGYTQDHLVRYQDQLDNNFYGDEPVDFKQFIQDENYLASDEFQDYLDSL